MCRGCLGLLKNLEPVDRANMRKGCMDALKNPKLIGLHHVLLQTWYELMEAVCGVVA